MYNVFVLHNDMCTIYTHYIMYTVYMLYYRHSLFCILPIHSISDIYSLCCFPRQKSIPFVWSLLGNRPPRFDPPCEMSSQKSTLPLGWNENQMNALIVGIQQDPLKGPPKKPEVFNSSSLTYLGVCCWQGPTLIFDCW